MLDKKIYTWEDIERMCVSIVNQMYTDNWRPDYIVGITRGGNVPATIISNMTGIRCEALKVSLRDAVHGLESNNWMAVDALGYPDSDATDMKKNILIVDDINDTGATFKHITEAIGSNDNLKFASIIHNDPSEFDKLDYWCYNINKKENPVWIVFPWEQW